MMINPLSCRTACKQQNWLLQMPWSCGRGSHWSRTTPHRFWRMQCSVPRLNFRSGCSPHTTRIWWTLSRWFTLHCPWNMLQVMFCWRHTHLDSTQEETWSETLSWISDKPTSAWNVSNEWSSSLVSCINSSICRPA